MKSIFVVAHHTRGEIAQLLTDLEAWCTKHGHHLWMLPADANARGCEHLASDRAAMDADVVLSLGGDEIVGAEIAQNAKPMRLTDGKLLIEARSTAWATQLRLMSGDLKRRIAAEGLELAEIEVVGPRSPSWRRGGWTVKGGRGPRDTYG